LPTAAKGIKGSGKLPARNNFLAASYSATLLQKQRAAYEIKPKEITKRICQDHGRRLCAARLP
jgi:hypothetical protein